MAAGQKLDAMLFRVELGLGLVPLELEFLLGHRACLNLDVNTNVYTGQGRDWASSRQDPQNLDCPASKRGANEHRVSGAGPWLNGRDRDPGVSAQSCLTAHEGEVERARR